MITMLIMISAALILLGIGGIMWGKDKKCGVSCVISGSAISSFVMFLLSM